MKSNKLPLKMWVILSCILYFTPLMSSEPKILVCIHGFMRTHRNMARFEKAFLKEGWVVFNYDYPSRSKKIQQVGRDLACALKDLSDNHPEKEIHFITHSLGGLVLRSAMQEKEFPRVAKQGKAVLIAPPNQGSCFARALKFTIISPILGKGAGYELMNERDFSHLGDFPKSVSVLVIAGTFGCNPCIWEKNDGKVGVSETRLSTDHQHVKVRTSHSVICLNKKVLKISKNFIEN